MNLHQAPLQATLKPDMATPHTTSTRVGGRRLLLMRLGWTLLTLYNLVIFEEDVYEPSIFLDAHDP